MDKSDGKEDSKRKKRVESKHYSLRSLDCLMLGFQICEPEELDFFVPFFIHTTSGFFPLIALKMVSDRVSSVNDFQSPFAESWLHLINSNGSNHSTRPDSMDYCLKWDLDSRLHNR